MHSQQPEEYKPPPPPKHRYNSHGTTRTDYGRSLKKGGSGKEFDWEGREIPQNRHNPHPMVY